MDLLNVLIGSFFVVISIGYVVYRFLYRSDEVDRSSMVFPNQVKIYIGFFILFLLGLLMIYRELKL